MGGNPEKRSVGTIPDAFSRGWGKIPNNPLVAASVAALFKGGPRARSLIGGWSADERDRLIYRHLGKRGGQIVIFLDPAAVAASEGAAGLAEQWSFLEKVSPFTVDVMLTVLAQLCEAGLGNKSKYPLLEAVPVTAGAVLRYKNLRRWGAEAAALRQRVDGEILRLTGLRFDVERFPAWDPELLRWNVWGVSATGDRLFEVADTQSVVWRRKGGPARDESVWRIRFGGWSQWWMNSQGKVWLAAIPRQLLELDHRSNRGSAVLARKIGLNTVLLWCAVRCRASLCRRTDHLLEDIGELPERDARNAHWGGRVRDRFDEALLMLQESGVFGDVAWPGDYETGGADRSKGWLDDWLASKIVLTRPETSGENAGAAEPPRRRKRRTRKAEGAFVELRRGSVIRSMRRKRNISQTRFAREIGISATYLSQIENEKRLVSKTLLRRVSDWARRNGETGRGLDGDAAVIALFDTAREQRSALNEGAQAGRDRQGLIDGKISRGKDDRP